MLLLVAKRQDGTLFSLLGKLERNKLLAMRKLETFYCPVCNECVQMRIGERRNWHFAHRAGADCSFKTEPESAYHLQGKQLLYEWLSSQSVHVKLEPYLSRLKQRPDLLLHTRPHHTALEFQCSTIDPGLLTKRTRTFQSYGLIPIWILGGNRLNRIGTNTFKVPQMDWFTFRKASREGTSLFPLYFCPKSKQFATLMNMIPYSPSKVWATPKFFPMSSFSVHDLYRVSAAPPFTVSDYWLTIKNKWRLRSFRWRTRPYRYLRKLYGDLSKIPAAAGWPTPHLYLIETSCFLWQSWLFHQFYLNWPSERPISLSQVKSRFRTLVRQNIFRIRTIPFLTTEDEGLALFEYLQCLCKFGFLQQVGKEEFRKNTTFGPSQSSKNDSDSDLEYFEKLPWIL